MPPETLQCYKLLAQPPATKKPAVQAGFRLSIDR
jgi:hypothetical protein